MRELESVLTSLFLKGMAGMKRSIWGILELTAVAGSCTVEWVTAKEGVSFREEERKRGEIAGAGGDVDW